MPVFSQHLGILSRKEFSSQTQKREDLTPSGIILPGHPLTLHDLYYDSALYIRSP